MSKTDPYRHSPYDAAGMPLGAETIDYDNKEDVAQHTVKDKVIEPVNLNDASASYTEPKLKNRTPVNPANFNSAIEVPGHIRPTKAQDIGEGIAELQPDFQKPVNIQEEADNPDDKDDFMEALKNA